MNRRQRTTIVVALLVIGVMLIFPPVWGGGYYALFITSHTIKQQALVLQILIVSVIAGALVLLFGGKSKV